jgi:glutathione peroxidase
MSPTTVQSIYEFSARLLDGREVRLADFRGQVLLIVNTASQCGFTPQYAGLETLYRTYSDRGFVALAFPCNQFGRQEPGDASQIGEFCARNFGVTFPVFSKIEVNGPHADPLYRFLKKQKRGGLGWLTGGRIAWNFTKFLVGRDGAVAGRFAPSTRPDSLTAAIERLLALTASSSSGYGNRDRNKASAQR